MQPLRYLLLPFSWLHGLVLWIRHGLYDKGILKSHRPAIPTIAVGNLSLGGTGKTPHIELFLVLLKGKGQLATLSRGYGRNTKGFLEVTAEMEALDVGDEPLQVKRKFAQVLVFVGEDRVAACEKIKELHPQVKAILLDDALQHRKLNASLKVLLTDHRAPYSSDHLFPAGKLRDLRSRANNAHVVIVTKAPNSVDDHTEIKWREQLQLLPEQLLFISSLEYGEAYRIEPGGTRSKVELDNNTNVLLLTGIANSTHLLEMVKRMAATVLHMEFPDHHAFTASDLTKVAARYGTFAAGPKWLMTTEKDLVRLMPEYWNGPLKHVPLIVQPVKARVLNKKEELSELLNAHVGEDQ